MTTSHSLSWKSKMRLNLKRLQITKLINNTTIINNISVEPPHTCANRSD